MARFSGKIGYCFDDVEIRPGVWEKDIRERDVFGDIYESTIKNENSGNVNDNINITNQISFIADPFAMHNFQRIKYVMFNEIKWKVNSVKISYPRLLLNLGGIYYDD